MFVLFAKPSYPTFRTFMAYSILQPLFPVPCSQLSANIFSAVNTNYAKPIPLLITIPMNFKSKIFLICFEKKNAMLLNLVLVGVRGNCM